MGRKPNPFTRPYKLTPEAIEQRRIAATDRWQALADAPKDARSLPGRPKKKRKHATRGSNGRFIAKDAIRACHS